MGRRTHSNPAQRATSGPGGEFLPRPSLSLYNERVSAGAGVHPRRQRRPRDAAAPRSRPINRPCTSFVWRPRVVGIKNWFGGGAKQDPGQKPAKKEEDYTIDDLIVLERY